MSLKAEVKLKWYIQFIRKKIICYILTDLKCPVEYLTNDKQFSYAYLAKYRR